MNRSGLILEGGGTRGIYTAGVLDVFMENGIHFDGVIGVSAGAIHGSSYVAEQMGRNLRYYKKYCNDKRLMGLRCFLLTGDIVGRKFCYYDLPERLDPFDYDTFKGSKTEFYVTCSNLETGKAEYLRLTDMRGQIDLLRASASLPYASRVVETEGMKLLDGGCTDSIPVRAFMEMGFTRNVAVLTRHKGYVKKPERQWLPGIFFHGYPKFAKALKNRHLSYNASVKDIEKLEAAGELFVIRPSVALSIGRMEKDPEKQEVYDIGRQDALKQLAELKRWMGVQECQKESV